MDKHNTARRQYQKQCRIERLRARAARLNELSATLAVFDREHTEQRTIRELNRAAGWQY